MWIHTAKKLNKSQAEYTNTKKNPLLDIVNKLMENKDKKNLQQPEKYILYKKAVTEIMSDFSSIKAKPEDNEKKNFQSTVIKIKST